MPKKKKEEVATAPLPAIDHAYVQTLKIQNLEERNEALRQELYKLNSDREQVQADESDVYEHMQRDLRSKASRIGELQRDLTETRTKLEDTIRTKDEMLTKQRDAFEEERTRVAQEMQELRNELHEVKAFQERRAVLEGDLGELSKQVQELKTRHEVEVADLKREFGEKREKGRERERERGGMGRSKVHSARVFTGPHEYVVTRHHFTVLSIPPSSMCRARARTK